MSDIVFDKVSKGFNGKSVIDGLSLTLREGGSYYIMGPSGIGKTTLVNMLLGLVKPDSGEIKGLQKERFACVFQEDRLIEQENAITNLDVIFRDKVPQCAIEEELKSVGLGADMLKPCAELSGGMKRRVAIVRAMIAQADTVILDEPFKGLDAELKQKVMDYVEDRIGARRLILITHDEAEGKYLCDNKIEL